TLSRDSSEIEVIIQLLIDNGADLSLKNDDNQTALDIGTQKLKNYAELDFPGIEEFKEIVDILKKAEEKAKEKKKSEEKTGEPILIDLKCRFFASFSLDCNNDSKVIGFKSSD
ncbi:MAG: hypothetical protein FWC41_03875, partial [Firmicutes bacterium]|nr:hypothetical protein [Bacillota bacterium]